VFNVYGSLALSKCLSMHFSGVDISLLVLLYCYQIVGRYDAATILHSHVVFLCFIFKCCCSQVLYCSKSVGVAVLPIYCTFGVIFMHFQVFWTLKWCYSSVFFWCCYYATFVSVVLQLLLFIFWYFDISLPLKSCYLCALLVC